MYDHVGPGANSTSHSRTLMSWRVCQIGAACRSANRSAARPRLQPSLRTGTGCETNLVQPSGRGANSSTNMVRQSMMRMTTILRSKSLIASTSNVEESEPHEHERQVDSVLWVCPKSLADALMSPLCEVHRTSTPSLGGSTACKNPHLHHHHHPMRSNHHDEQLRILRPNL